MTQLLERAFARVAELPDSEQDAIATLIMDEMESEDRWQKLFQASPDLLTEMAAEARAEYAAGKTKVLDPDAL